MAAYVAHRLVRAPHGVCPSRAFRAKQGGGPSSLLSPRSREVPRLLCCRGNQVRRVGHHARAPNLAAGSRLAISREPVRASGWSCFPHGAGVSRGRDASWIPSAVSSIAVEVPEQDGAAAAWVTRRTSLHSSICSRRLSPRGQSFALGPYLSRPLGHRGPRTCCLVRERPTRSRWLRGRHHDVGSRCKSQEGWSPW